MKFHQITADEADVRLKSGRVSKEEYEAIKNALVNMKEAVFIELDGERPEKVRKWIGTTAKSLKIDAQIKKTPGGFTVKARE